MLFSKETLKSYAASRGIINIEDAALEFLSQDLEYRVKELCQEATKFTNASHRLKLTIDDVNYALVSRNIDPLFGYDPTESLNFKHLNNYFYIADDEIDLEDFLNKPLPKIPLKPSITQHWLAIEGVQPAIPQNPLNVPKRNAATLQTYFDDTEKSHKHILTKELQLYFDKICNYIMGTTAEKNMALECLEKDSGIQQLIPYFIQNFSEQITSQKEAGDYEGIQLIIAMIYALLKNKYIFIDPYLHQIVPALLTGVLGKNYTIETREISSDAVRYLFVKFSGAYNSLAPRIINTLKRSWINGEKTEDVQYGALYCLSILGSNVVDDIVRKHAHEYFAISESGKVNDLLNSLIK